MTILWSIGIFFPILVCSTEKNLATLCESSGQQALLLRPLHLQLHTALALLLKDTLFSSKTRKWFYL
jgi:hypothetical protein